MITDNQANFLYLADTLPVKYPAFAERLFKALNECSIPFAYLPGTKDVWAVDYMPLQIGENKFVQFQYCPDYLMSSSKWRSTITNVDMVCDKIGIERIHSDIILDGGNVIKSSNAVILCDKVFKENPVVGTQRLIDELSKLFEVDKIVFIPQDPEDYVGHADGMVRFINDNKVLVNGYRRDYHPEFQRKLRDSLESAELEVVELVYAPDDTSYDSAVGLYMNYFEFSNNIIVPTFGTFDKSQPWNLNKDCQADELAVITLENVFPNHDIRVLDCADLAVNGGVLNCISWQFRR